MLDLIKKKPKDAKIPITTTVTRQMWDDCKKKGLSWQFLLVRGYESLEAFEKLRERLTDTETGRKKFEELFHHYRSKVLLLEQEIENLKVQR